MEFDELLELLEIDSPQDLAYFEQFAELAECEEEISEDTLAQFFADVDKSIIEELCATYFDEILSSIPDDSVEFYSTMLGMSQAFKATAQSLDNDENRVLFAEIFFKFRNWMLFDSEVYCTNVTTGENITVSILQALSMYRAQNLSEEEFDYDFDNVLEYPIDEYIIPISNFEDDDDIDLYDDVDDE